VLSGNRNFEARIHPNLKANFLASPPLVVAYALAGNVLIDLMTEPSARARTAADVFIGDIWPTERGSLEADEVRHEPEAFEELRPRSRRNPGELWRRSGRPRGRSTTGRSPPTSRSRRSSTASR
jgi:aconitate hydratase